MGKVPAANAFAALGALYGLLGVAFGAFGAHALRERLPAEMLAVYRTGVEYQMYHAAALIGVGLLGIVQPARTPVFAGCCFAAGVVLFSGSLYLLAITEVRLFGAATPLGGMLFLLGWAALARSFLRIV
jgi:uncharacterized membrane protein YgdD (TMEM256/DUF423 family)